MVPACHPILLTYVQPELEAAFADFHNHAVSSLEKMGCRLGVLVIAIYYMANIVRGIVAPVEYRLRFEADPVWAKPLLAKRPPCHTMRTSSGQPIPFHTTILTYLIFTTSIEALRWSRPTFFFRYVTTGGAAFSSHSDDQNQHLPTRYREHMQLVKRLVCFSLACLVQEDESANSAGGAIFNYGMTSAIFSAFENKVGNV